MRPIRTLRLGATPNCSSLGNVLNVLLWTQATVAAIWVAAESWEARRRRPEPDGGETRRVDDPPALVRTGEGGGPLEAHVQITSACTLPCPACYMDTAAEGPHVPVATLQERLKALADQGVLRVAFGGGEVLRHPDLPRIAALARAAGLSPGTTTSGAGPTEALDAFDQVNVSLDGLGEVYRRARGYAGDEAALATIRRLAARGVRVGVNVVLDRDTLPALGETVAAAAAAGATEIQLLRLKPAGRARDTYTDRRLTPAQGESLWPQVQGLMARHPTLTFRIDCALVPFLAAHRVDPERLRAFAFWGCHGGDELVSMDPAGQLHPCSFFAGPVDERWRTGVAAEPCRSCDYHDTCRGGCHVVAAHLTGETFAPDPECPLVYAAAAQTPSPQTPAPEVHGPGAAA